MFDFRIGLACMNRPYLPRSLDSLMSKGLNNYRGSATVELFDGVGNPEYLAPLQRKYPTIIIRSDGKRHNVVENFFQMWNVLSNDSEYCMFFPDDFIVCLDFLQFVSQFIDKWKEYYNVFSFYSPFIEVCEAFKKGLSHWVIPAKLFYGGVGLTMKSRVVKQLVDFAVKHHLHCKRKEQDLTVNKFLVASKWNVIASAPNLCQHIGKVSVIGNQWRINTGDRFAPCFIGEEISALEISKHADSLNVQFQKAWTPP